MKDGCDPVSCHRRLQKGTTTPADEEEERQKIKRKEKNLIREKSNE